jgi:hypothetical protein
MVKLIPELPPRGIHVLSDAKGLQGFAKIIEGAVPADEASPLIVILETETPKAHPVSLAAGRYGFHAFNAGDEPPARGIHQA